MKKKNILIVMTSLYIGGAETSLIGLLKSIDYAKYDVDLFLYRQEGELLSDVPKQVKLLPEIEVYKTFTQKMSLVIKNKHFIMVAIKGLSKIITRLMRFGKNNGGGDARSLFYPQMFACPFLPKISNKEYDLVISFMVPHVVVPKKALYKKSIAWIHTDYTNVKADIKREYKMWNKYDYIASISEKSTQSFLNIYPNLKNKVIEIENILIPKEVKQKADDFLVFDEIPNDVNVVKLLSIGRFSVAKNFDNIPNICKFILKSGYKVKWYLIGYGSEESLIKAKIKGNNMEENVIILGKKENPYPYIKACDIYVQPSRYEGKAVTVREAQMLCKPVVITNYETAKSQLTDGFDGLIVPMDNDSCADAIVRLIKDSDLQKQLIQNCKNTDYGNENEVEKIYELMGDLE
ncbi:glycosyl transferase [Clostridia bacterium]|nr:glycosyl transferase [Clostridia bacterium]